MLIGILLLHYLENYADHVARLRYTGLYTQFQRIETHCDAANTDEVSEDTSDVNCDRLSDDQCNYLEQTRDSANLALSANVILVITYAVIMFFGKRRSGKILYAVIAFAIIFGLIFLVSAFSATSSYQSLLGKLNFYVVYFS
jgi:hypothetical protein